MLAVAHTTESVRPPRILVVDDEAAARVSLAEVLRLEGYEVEAASCGEDALERFRAGEAFDVLLVDLKMPGMDGLELIESVRPEMPDTLVILLTAFGTLDTAIKAMRCGAHDYLLKPSSVPDILSSIQRGLAEQRQERQRAQLVGQLKKMLNELATIEAPDAPAQSDPVQPGRFLQVDDIVLDRQKRVIIVGQNCLDLTPTEYKMLNCLMETPNEVWSPQDLVRRVQGYETDAWGARAIVRVHIRRLRKKLEKCPSEPTYILNVRGAGYMFAIPAEDNHSQ